MRDHICRESNHCAGQVCWTNPSYLRTSCAVPGETLEPSPWSQESHSTLFKLVSFKWPIHLHATLFSPFRYHLCERLSYTRNLHPTKTCSLDTKHVNLPHSIAKFLFSFLHQALQSRISFTAHYPLDFSSVPDPEQPEISYIWYIHYNYFINVCLFSFIKSGPYLYCWYLFITMLHSVWSI